MQFTIPEQIESERLILRTFRHEDWNDLFLYYSDEDTTRYTIGRTLNEAETWRTMAGMVGHWTLRGFGPYALEEKQSGKVIGVTGLWYPNDWPEPEIKWGLAKTYHRQGYAYEAARRVKLMIKEFLPGTIPISLINCKNEPSIQLALALGCTAEKNILFRGMECTIYRHTL